MPRTNFAVVWEEMARTAVQGASQLSRPAGTPVEWVDQYAVSDDRTRSNRSATRGSASTANRGVRRATVRSIRDLTPRWRRVPADATPFRGDIRRTRRESWCSTSPTTATH
jgi:hypothetical protein